MKIAIMSAMQEELQPILAALGEYETVVYAKNNYYRTTLNNHEIILAYSKIGKVFSALTATTLIEKFGCEVLLFSGVAGAVNPALKVGDLIYGTKLAQHDLDISIFGHPYGYVPEGAVYIASDPALNAIAMEVARDSSLALQGGVIATGDQFIANEERKNWIAQTFNADALEMEGGSVAVVCDALGVPFFVLRAISDSADMDADFSFDTFLESSAKISAEFVIKMAGRL